ncbi:dienelactone hydrolase family protein [Nocardia sp. NPDC052001]|uniref:dienelactone hydrolase family protein n=1 Tax=Nocardia sp. NPDC052001 TaxID=3154853 RepID=UPI003437D197
MLTIALFHSVYGLRTVEMEAGRRLRELGNTVHVPDLYHGQVASTLDTGFELKDRIGWDTIVARAAHALAGLPATTVLTGFSMGCGVIQDLLPSRPATAAVLLLHGYADIPADVRANLPVQVHISASDRFAPAEQLTAWQARARRHGAVATVHTYPGAGHFYTDDTLPDFDRRAAELTWERATRFLTDLEPRRPRAISNKRDDT